jgi:hypothetical protein
MVTLRASAGLTSDRRFCLAAEPQDLGQALWWQFLLSVCELRNHTQCQVCGRWYELSPQVNRSDRLYCSDACRFKAYRRRRRQAVEMFRERRSIAQIAKELGSDRETIKGWVRESTKGTKR